MLCVDMSLPKLSLLESSSVNLRRGLTVNRTYYFCSQDNQCFLTTGIPSKCVKRLQSAQTSSGRTESKICGVPGATRTLDPLLRRQPLYPAELQGQVTCYQI